MSTNATMRVAKFDGTLLRAAAVEALVRLNPAAQWRNPVMFVVYLGACLCTLLWLQAWLGAGEAAPVFVFSIAVWLWFTVLFANFGEALAAGRGKAQAAALRSSRADVPARRVHEAKADAEAESVPAGALRPGDLVVVQAGEFLPGDGEVVVGVASVDESAITGESAPVIREAGGDRSAVTGGTRVLSDWLVVRITAGPGESFLDRMIAMVEGAKRQKTPNELALDVLLAALTLAFLLVCVTLRPFSAFAVEAAGAGAPVTITALVALLVCLIPTTIGGLLAAIRIAGLDRLVKANVIATSGRAVEAAGDVDVLLLDKTGTITLGARQAVELLPAPGVTVEQLADAAQLASFADETPEGRSIVVLCKRHGLRERDLGTLHATFVPFSARTRMSGVDIGPRCVRKGSAEALTAHVRSRGGQVPPEIVAAVDTVSRRGATPLVVADGARVLGVIELRDVVKGGLHERFAELRRMGIRTVMITGDNPITAAAIAAEAGVDDFLAEATPEAKLACIQKYQAGGHLVAMTGDGTNDAPALAQADVAVAMQTGTQAAREAGNMVDLDSNPTKLIEIVAIGKQLLMTRGSLTTFSLANDVAKYLAILPAVFVPIWPQLAGLDVMRLHSPESAVLSAVVFNALILIALVPLALRGVAYRPRAAAELLRRNLLVYGVCGVFVPFLGIKGIDLVIARTRTLLRTLHMRACIVVFVFLSLLCGIVYPLAVTGIAQLVCPERASGSVVREGDRTVGAELIGQQFDHPAYVWGRPSATKTPYAPCQTDLSAGSGGSNLGPLHPDLRTGVAARVEALRAAAKQAGVESTGLVPIDLVTASGSGLDPHVSPAAAEFQVERIARVRAVEATRVREVLANAVAGRQFGLLGEPVVSVLAANLALDRAFGIPGKR